MVLMKALWVISLVPESLLLQQPPQWGLLRLQPPQLPPMEPEGDQLRPQRPPSLIIRKLLQVLEEVLITTSDQKAKTVETSSRTDHLLRFMLLLVEDLLLIISLEEQVLLDLEANDVTLDFPFDSDLCKLSNVWLFSSMNFRSIVVEGIV